MKNFYLKPFSRISDENPLRRIVWGEARRDGVRWCERMWGGRDCEGVRWGEVRLSGSSASLAGWTDYLSFLHPPFSCQMWSVDSGFSRKPRRTDLRLTCVINYFKLHYLTLSDDLYIRHSRPWYMVDLRFPVISRLGWKFHSPLLLKTWAKFETKEYRKRTDIQTYRITQYYYDVLYGEKWQ